MSCRPFSIFFYQITEGIVQNIVYRNVCEKGEYPICVRRSRKGGNVINVRCDAPNLYDIILTDVSRLSV